MMLQRKIKIAHILTPITFGGAEKVSLNFLRTINGACFDVILILLIRPWEELPYFAHEIEKLGFKYHTVPVAIHKGRDFQRLTRVVCRIFEILRQGSFNLVHTQGYFANICGLPPARLLGLNTISTCHGFISTDWKLRIYNQLDKVSLRLSKKIIAVSNDIKSDLICSGIDNNRIIVVPNAVASAFSQNELLIRRQEKRAALSISSEDLVVGYAGRLSEEKGVMFLIEAGAELLKKEIPLKLVIIGDGPERVSIEKKVKSMNLANEIVFTGFQAEIENWLPVMDIFVLPSLTEGTPMALLEAMAMGIPVVATSVGGVPNVVDDGVNGLLIPPADFKAISNSIQYLTNNQELKHQIGKAGIVTIKNKYDIDQWCKTIEGHYYDIESG